MLQPGALHGNPAPLGLGVVRWGLAALKGVLELSSSLEEAPALEHAPQLFPPQQSPTICGVEVAGDLGKLGLIWNDISRFCLRDRAGMFPG